jgi:hypothetical protein
MDCWYIPYYHLFHSQTQLSPPNLVGLCKERKNHALLFFSSSNQPLSFLFIYVFINGYVVVVLIKKPRWVLFSFSYFTNFSSFHSWYIVCWVWLTCNSWGRLRSWVSGAKLQPPPEWSVCPRGTVQGYYGPN